MAAAAVLALLAGCALAAQAAVNTRLGTRIGGAIPAAVFSAVIATLLLLLVLAVRGDIRKPFGGVREPVWLWTGGAFGAFGLVVLSYSPRRIGVLAAILLVIAGQVAAGTLIDGFGWLGAARTAVGVGRLVGIALVLAGALLVLRSR